MKNILKNIEWKSKKVIAILVAAAIVVVGGIGTCVYLGTRETQPESIQVYYNLKALDPNTTAEDVVFGRALTMNTGEKIQLKTKIEPEDCKMSVTWAVKSGDKAAVTLTKDGVLTAEAEGTVVVSATIGEGKHECVGTLTVKVEKSEAELVQELKEEIEALPDTENLTAEDQEKVNELVEKYNSLSGMNKSELAEESAKLQNASNKIEQITGTKPDVAMPAEEPTSENTTVSGGTDSGTTFRPSGGSSSGSGTTSKPSGGSSGGSSGSNTTSKPSGGGSSGSNTTSKPSTGGSTSKPETTTSKPTTTQPAKKEFAMTKDEIIAYASDYIEDTYHSTYNPGFGKDVPGTGYNAPTKVFRSDSTEVIKQALRWAADATYLPGGWYKVYVEQIDENTMRVYMFYA